MVLSSVGLALCLLFLYVMVKAGRNEREKIVQIKLNDDELENLWYFKIYFVIFYIFIFLHLYIFTYLH